MADHTPHDRWTDTALAPAQVSDSGTYPGVPAGPVRRAALYDTAGTLLGHVWTDGTAAGFLDNDAAGPAAIRAGARGWRKQAEAHQAGRPAARLHEPA
ncbi:hypothetical protein, partial [Microbispora sp. NPDC049633]|uniref:hypothetical protein n=1 Tax=Microbispora sp. NPDC049633 TaxID=3154355 RepID=UPI00341B82CA